MCECTPSRAELLQMRFNHLVAVVERVHPASAEVLRNAVQQRQHVQAAVEYRRRQQAINPPQPNFNELFGLVTPRKVREYAPVRTRMR